MDTRQIDEQWADLWRVRKAHAEWLAESFTGMATTARAAGETSVEQIATAAAKQFGLLFKDAALDQPQGTKGK